MRLHAFGIVLLAAAGLSTGITACRHRAPDSLLASFDEQYVPVFYMNERLARGQDECINNLANATSEALADGLLMNGSLTGLGTNTPVGPKMATDAAYFQLLRIFSIFDWRFADALRSGSVRCLPDRVGLGYGIMPKSYASGLPQPYQDHFEKLRSALQSLTRDAPAFAVVKAEALYPPERWPKIPAGDAAFRNALSTGGMANLEYIRQDAARTDNLKARLKGMAGAFVPLSISYNSVFPSRLTDGKTYMEAYLPPFYELAIGNFDQPGTWQLTRGMKKTELPRQVDISIAKLTHIGYLQDLPPGDEPVIKAQIYKEYQSPDKLVVRAVFGKVDSSGPEPGYFPLEYRDFRSALYVSFYPNFEIKPNDSSVERLAKKEFNELVNVIRVDARIHQLTVELSRKPNQNPLKDGIDALLLSPHFSMKDSDISFRVYLDATSSRGRSALETTGFTCAPGSGDTAACYRDFGAFEELNQYFANESSGLASHSEHSGWAGRFKQGLNALTRRSTRFLINWKMEEIERAIDAQFVELFSMVADKQSEARRKINERLERELFAERH